MPDSVTPDARARHAHRIDVAIDDLNDLDAVVEGAHRAIDTALAHLCVAEQARAAARCTLERLIASGERSDGAAHG